MDFSYLAVNLIIMYVSEQLYLKVVAAFFMYIACARGYVILTNMNNVGALGPSMAKR